MSQVKKSVFITGASSGIGYSLAIEFAKRGYKVFAGARRLKAMEPLKQYGITPVELDLTSSDSIKAAYELVSTQIDGKLDILYNNAGTLYRSPIFDADIKQIEHVFKVNVFGPLEIIKIFQKELLEAQGTVIFTSSIAKYVPMPFAVAYTASKSAFSTIPKVLSLETSKLGIKVVDVATGAVESEIWDYETPEVSKTSVYYLEGTNVLKPIESAATPTDVYVKTTIDRIERSIRRNISYTEFYAGASTWVARFFNAFIPFKLFSKIMLGALKLNDPLERIAKKFRKKD